MCTAAGRKKVGDSASTPPTAIGRSPWAAIRRSPLPCCFAIKPSSADWTGGCMWCRCRARGLLGRSRQRGANRLRPRRRCATGGSTLAARTDTCMSWGRTEKRTCRIETWTCLEFAVRWAASTPTRNTIGTRTMETSRTRTPRIRNCSRRCGSNGCGDTRARSSTCPFVAEAGCTRTPRKARCSRSSKRRDACCGADTGQASICRSPRPFTIARAAARRRKRGRTRIERIRVRPRCRNGFWFRRPGWASRVCGAWTRRRANWCGRRPLRARPVGAGRPRR